MTFVRMSAAPDPDVQKFRERLRTIQSDSKEVIRVMTAEQAVLALKIMREAGRREHR